MVLNLDGIFIARILQNLDPLGRERLFVRVLGVHDISDQFENKSYGIWVDHCAPYYYTSGNLPPVGSEVYIQFCKGTDNVYDPMRAIWLGTVRKNFE